MIQQSSPASKLYWCHSCKHQFPLPLPSPQQIVCPKCHQDFCQQIHQSTNPKGYIPFRQKKHKPRNLTKHLQINYFICPEESTIIANEELLQRIHQMLANSESKGAPPASKEEVEKLERKGYQGEKGRECSICQEEFQQGGKVVAMPCEHMFHEVCVVTWLENRNSCPECRYELRTDDERYESKKGKKE